jgi:hypothetical protein
VEQLAVLFLPRTRADESQLRLGENLISQSSRVKDSLSAASYPPLQKSQERGTHGVVVSRRSKDQIGFLKDGPPADWSASSVSLKHRFYRPPLSQPHTKQTDNRRLADEKTFCGGTFSTPTTVNRSCAELFFGTRCLMSVWPLCACFRKWCGER